MGDIVSLVEKAARDIDAGKGRQDGQEDAEGQVRPQRPAEQLQQMQKLGGMGG
jgi:signal recognition particle subunit SRP54